MQSKWRSFYELIKVEEMKAGFEEKLADLHSQSEAGEVPSTLKDFSSFCILIKWNLDAVKDADLRNQILKKLVHKVKVTPNSFKIHYFVGEHTVQDLTENLERNSEFTDAKNKKPEVDFAASGLKSVFGSNRVEIGVTVWSTVEPIAILFEVDVKHFTIRKDGTIKPANTIGNLCIPRTEFENKVRELVEVQRHSISHVAKELGASITTVRRVCRTLKIGSYSETNKGIVSRSSQVPFGWDIIQGRLVQNEREWMWVQKIHELRKQGTSLHRIADFLILEKVPTKNGGKWFAKTVSQVLKYNKTYLDCL